MRILACLLATGVLAGCTTTREDLMKEPVLTPVGTGLHQFPPVVQPQAAYSPEPPRHVNSLWTGRNADFFRDTRALNVGDIVTVKIKIDDKANDAASSSDDTVAPISTADSAFPVLRVLTDEEVRPGEPKCNLIVQTQCAQLAFRL